MWFCCRYYIVLTYNTTAEPLNDLDVYLGAVEYQGPLCVWRLASAWYLERERDREMCGFIERDKKGGLQPACLLGVALGTFYSMVAYCEHGIKVEDPRLCLYGLLRSTSVQKLPRMNQLNWKHADVWWQRRFQNSPGDCCMLLRKRSACHLDARQSTSVAQVNFPLPVKGLIQISSLPE